MRWRRAVPLLALVAACSTIGDPGGMPDGLPHGGTGAFRLLDAEEVGIVGSLPGRALVVRDAIERASPIDGSLYYATARVLDEPPMLPEDHPGNEIYWPAFEPRRIHRGETFGEGIGAFATGPEVLAASEAWEGGEVFDPFAVVDGDTVRLYYAGAGGIGVAEASAGGAFTKIAGPIVADARHPSVVRGLDGAWWMYFESAGAIHAARSTDGRAFNPMGPIALGGEDLGDGTELRVASPGAVRVETRGERALIRLYFESVRSGVVEDLSQEAHLLYVAGSADGLAFDRHPLPVMEQTDARFPAPVLVDDRITLLYANLPFFGGAFLTRAVVVAVGPGGVRFAPEE